MARGTRGSWLMRLLLWRRTLALRILMFLVLWVMGMCLLNNILLYRLPLRSNPNSMLINDIPVAGEIVATPSVQAEEADDDDETSDDADSDLIVGQSSELQATALGRKVAELISQNSSIDADYVGKLLFPNLASIFVSVENHRKLRKRDPLTARAVSKLLPARSPNPRYATCAVVGNSGILKRSRYGNAIDKHDAVLRLNQAPVKGYEPFAGHGTTYRLLNHKWTTVFYQEDIVHAQSHFLFRQETPNTTLIVSRGSRDDFESLSLCQRRRRPDLNTLFLSSQVVSRARALLRRFAQVAPSTAASAKDQVIPSTGLLGIYLMLQFCDKVSVYGFSLESSTSKTAMKESKTPYHYFKKYVDSEVLRAHPHHSFKLEGDLLVRLHEAGIVRLCASPQAGAIEMGNSCGYVSPNPSPLPRFELDGD
eukprot:jgi/Mesvir1/9934/Mv06637-RA.1